MNNNRRILLKRAMALSAVGVAVSTGLLKPEQAMAAYPAHAFHNKDASAALKSVLGIDNYQHSDAIKIKAPDIAENGAVVPITISSSLPDVDSITILSEANPSPLIASFNLEDGAKAYISTRIKMGKTGNVVAVLKSGGKLYANKKEVKVTIGGCGG